MEVQILHLVEGAKQAKGLTVIIDVFRAFTVETYLMRNHAEKIIPVSGIEFAFEYQKAHPDAILCGERHGIMVEGFHYGNSPSQIENVDFTGKTVIHTTSAGTQGIANAANADEIIGGNLVAAKAIAAYIKQKNPEYVSLVCMGLSGDTQTDEDELCGKYIKSLLDDAPLVDMEDRMKRIMHTDGAKFFDPDKQSVFPERDFHLCTQLDSCNFILRLKKDPETGLDYMERVDVDCSILEEPQTNTKNRQMLSAFTPKQASHFPIETLGSLVYGDLADNGESFDCALVLGGSPRVLKSRAQAAAKLYAQGRCKLFIPTGGVKWATEFGHLSECEALTRYLTQMGVPESCIIFENSATTTKENMAYCKTILQQLALGHTPKVAVVTSRFHVRRSVGLANHYIPEAQHFGIGAEYPCDNAKEFMNDPKLMILIPKEASLLCASIHSGLIPDIAL